MIYNRVNTTHARPRFLPRVIGFQSVCKATTRGKKNGTDLSISRVGRNYFRTARRRSLNLSRVIAASICRFRRKIKLFGWNWRWWSVRERRTRCYFCGFNDTEIVSWRLTTTAVGRRWKMSYNIYNDLKIIL